jgi:hypothetical protein
MRQFIVRKIDWSTDKHYSRVSMPSKVIDVEDPHLPTFTSAGRLDLAQTLGRLGVPFFIRHVKLLESNPIGTSK